MIEGMKSLRTWWVALVLVLMHGVSAIAAELPPQPAEIKKLDGNWVPFVIALILGFAVLAPTFKSSKRTHLD